MDSGPSVKRSSETVDRNEFWQVVQCQVVLAASDRRNTLMEWLVNMSVFHESPNYLCDHDVICTYKEVSNMMHRVNKYYNVAMNHYHGEPPDQVISGWHMIIDSGVRLSQNYIPRPPITIVPRIALIDSKCYHKMFIKPSVSTILYHWQLALISWHSKEATNNPISLGAIWNSVDQIINQRETLEYTPNKATRYSFICNEATYIDDTTSQLTHNASTHHHFSAMYEYFYPPPQRRPIQPHPSDLPIWRSSTDCKHKYAFISENISVLAETSQPLEPDVETMHFYGKKRKAVRIDELVDSGDTNYLMKAADEWGEKRRKKR
jgi:hypothetical protein